MAPIPPPPASPFAQSTVSQTQSLPHPSADLSSLTRLGDLNGWMSALVILLTAMLALFWDRYKYRNDKRIEAIRDRTMILCMTMDMEARGNLVLTEENPLHRFVLLARRQQADYEDFIKHQEQQRQRYGWIGRGPWGWDCCWTTLESSKRYYHDTTQKLRSYSQAGWNWIQDSGTRWTSTHTTTSPWTRWKLAKAEVKLEEKMRMQRDAYIASYDQQSVRKHEQHQQQQRARSCSRTRKIRSEESTHINNSNNDNRDWWRKIWRRN